VGHPLSAVLTTQERTRAWLARKTGKSEAYVTKVINGSRRPSDDFKARAADALGIPVHLLFPVETSTESVEVSA
jgi:transcriptional regulator with XRE-family HTH domain